METEYLEDNLRLVEAFEFQEELMAAIEKQNKANVKLPALIPIDLKSLPWTARESEIQEFLGVDTARVMITLNEYRKPSGEARAWVRNEQDADRQSWSRDFSEFKCLFLNQGKRKGQIQGDSKRALHV